MNLKHGTEGPFKRVLYYHATTCHDPISSEQPSIAQDSVLLASPSSVADAASVEKSSQQIVAKRAARKVTPRELKANGRSLAALRRARTLREELSTLPESSDPEGDYTEPDVRLSERPEPEEATG